MVANANNNNNNNNINDNKFNANQNDLNEGNANAAVDAMNMVGMGGRQFVKRSPAISSKGQVANVILTFLDLWMKILAANSKDCQRLHFCLVNEQIASSNSLDHWELSQICSLGVAKFAAGKNQTDLKLLLMAGQYGRSGLDCNRIYKDCGFNEQRYKYD